MDTELTLYLCDCGCGAIAVSTQDMGDDDKFICLSLWQHGVDTCTAWRERLRHIWHIVRHGHPYTDTVLLTPERAHGLGSELREMAEAAVMPKAEGPHRKPVASFDHSV